jgi:hypothetical protein
MEYSLVSILMSISCGSVLDPRPQVGKACRSVLDKVPRAARDPLCRRSMSPKWSGRPLHRTLVQEPVAARRIALKRRRSSHRELRTEIIHRRIGLVGRDFSNPRGRSERQPTLDPLRAHTSRRFEFGPPSVRNNRNQTSQYRYPARAVQMTMEATQAFM